MPVENNTFFFHLSLKLHIERIISLHILRWIHKKNTILEIIIAILKADPKKTFFRLIENF